MRVGCDLVSAYGLSAPVAGRTEDGDLRESRNPAEGSSLTTAEAAVWPTQVSGRVAAHRLAERAALPLRHQDPGAAGRRDYALPPRPGGNRIHGRRRRRFSDRAAYRKMPARLTSARSRPPPRPAARCRNACGSRTVASTRRARCSNSSVGVVAASVGVCIACGIGRFRRGGFFSRAERHGMDSRCELASFADRRCSGGAGERV
jgi:hypothetical protein